MSNLWFIAYTSTLEYLGETDRYVFSYRDRLYLVKCRFKYVYCEPVSSAYPHFCVCRQLTRHVRNLTRNPAKEDTLVGYLDILDLKCYLLPQWLLICITELRHEIQRYWVWIYAHKYVGYCECRKDRGDLWRRPVWHACILCMLQEPTFLHLLYIQTTISLLHARYPIHLFPFIFFP